jgi:hypothetical protein
MAVDYCVALDCDPKLHFGNGNCFAGSADILERLKSRDRGAVLVQLATQKGEDAAGLRITLRVPDRNGNPVQKEVSLAELQAEAKPLEAQSAACSACPANFLGKPYGCFGVVNYPIPAAAEKWLLGRVQPFGTVGANLCLDFMSEFGVSGDPIRQMREGGFFENPKAQKITFKKGFLKSVSITADQLLETILMAGEALNPGHCFGILLWLGAIKVDGKVPGGPEDQATIQRLMTLTTRKAKEQHTALETGPPPASEEAQVFGALVKAIYLSWLHDVPLLMSA